MILITTFFRSLQQFPNLLPGIRGEGGEQLASRATVLTAKPLPPATKSWGSQGLEEPTEIRIYCPADLKT
jgi:hypothetical protein